jgi:hypothetical protein
MKIQRTDNLSSLQTGIKPGSPESAGTAFEEVLRKALSEAPGTARSGVVGGIPPAGAGMAFARPGERGELLNRADELIGLLESLQAGISGPGLSVKEAYASVRTIEDRADELAPLVERLPEGDPFRDFMNRIVITASVEAIKFRRGDYL